jgi:hypothetical protein
MCFVEETTGFVERVTRFIRMRVKALWLAGKAWLLTQSIRRTKVRVELQIAKNREAEVKTNPAHYL